MAPSVCRHCGLCPGAHGTDSGAGARAATTSPATEVAMLHLKLRTLEKYKTNYELLCGQLGELNGQIGLQLQKHELDVQTLNSTITQLQQANQELQNTLEATQTKLAAEEALHRQDREYSERIHRQLNTAAELLKTSERRNAEQVEALEQQLDALERQQAADAQVVSSLRSLNARLEKELEVSRQEDRAAKSGGVQKINAWKRKYREAKVEWEAQQLALQDELAEQRGQSRRLHKQVLQITSEKATLERRVTHVQDDAAHLADMIEQLRSGNQTLTKRCHRWKRRSEELERLIEAKEKAIERLEEQVLGAQEELIQRNARMDEQQQTLQSLRKQAQASENALVTAQQVKDELQTRVDELERALSEKNEEAQSYEKAQVHRYRKEVQHLRQLLALNQQKTQESSKDMETLKRDLISVQHVLRSYRQQHHEPVPKSSNSDDGDEANSALEARRAQRAERAVLKHAIQDQMRAMAAS